MQEPNKHVKGYIQLELRAAGRPAGDCRRPAERSIAS